MSEDSTTQDDDRERCSVETDHGTRLEEASTIHDSSPSSHWVWLKKMLWEERKGKVGATKDEAQWTRKRKQSVVDPFLKRFSTRELHVLNQLPEGQLNNRSPILTDQDRLLKHDNITKKIDPEQAACKLSDNTAYNTKQKGDFGVFNPKSSFIYLWNCFLACGIFYHLWTIIFRIAFLEGDGSSGGQIAFLVFDYIVDVVYILDMIISSRISFLENGILVKDVKRVAFKYLFTRAFYIDVLAILPVDLFYIAFGITPTLRLIRLVKVYKLLKIKTEVESMSSFPAFLRASLLVHSMLLLIHWNAAFYFMISRSEGFGLNEWVYPSPLNDTFMDLTRKYARSFHWSTSTLTATGDTPAPETNLE